MSTRKPVFSKAILDIIYHEACNDLKDDLNDPDSETREYARWILGRLSLISRQAERHFRAVLFHGFTIRRPKAVDLDSLVSLESWIYRQMRLLEQEAGPARYIKDLTLSFMGPIDKPKEGDSDCDSSDDDSSEFEFKSKPYPDSNMFRCSVTLFIDAIPKLLANFKNLTRFHIDNGGPLDKRHCNGYAMYESTSNVTVNALFDCIRRNHSLKEVAFTKVVGLPIRHLIQALPASVKSLQLQDVSFRPVEVTDSEEDPTALCSLEAATLILKPKERLPSWLSSPSSSLFRDLTKFTFHFHDEGDVAKGFGILSRAATTLQQITLHYYTCPLSDNALGSFPTLELPNLCSLSLKLVSTPVNTSHDLTCPPTLSTFAYDHLSKWTSSSLESLVLDFEWHIGPDSSVLYEAEDEEDEHGDFPGKFVDRNISRLGPIDDILSNNNTFPKLQTVRFFLLGKEGGSSGFYSDRASWNELYGLRKQYIDEAKTALCSTMYRVRGAGGTFKVETGLLEYWEKYESEIEDPFNEPKWWQRKNEDPFDFLLE